jgi:hypothetical protein
MSDHKVLKAFNTVNRRLKIGDPVNEGDDLSPHSFDELKLRGFIGSDEPERVVPPSSFPDAFAQISDGE